MVCGDKYFSIQLIIIQLTMLLAFAQTGKGYGDLNASKMMISS